MWVVVWCACYFAKVGHLSCSDECVGIWNVVKYFPDSCVSDVVFNYFCHLYSEDAVYDFVPEGVEFVNVGLA